MTALVSRSDLAPVPALAPPAVRVRALWPLISSAVVAVLVTGWAVTSAAVIAPRAVAVTLLVVLVLVSAGWACERARRLGL